MTYRTKLYILVLIIAAVAATGLWWVRSEDHTLAGRKVDYHKIYDVFWDVACDTAMDGSDRGCYVQYVDVYRPRPDFAAAMVEVLFHTDAQGQPDPHLRFDIEPGLSFEDTRIAVQTTSDSLPIDISHCSGETCRLNGDAARKVLADWRIGETLRLTIDEGRDSPAQLSWPLQNINAILDDLAAQRAERGLP